MSQEDTNSAMDVLSKAVDWTRKKQVCSSTSLIVQGFIEHVSMVVLWPLEFMCSYILNIDLCLNIVECILITVELSLYIYCVCEVNHDWMKNLY